jgi:molybdenum cofactor cytidylyltransferase
MAKPGPPRLAAVLLAAGASRRFGPENKLLALVNGVPLLAVVARAIADGGISDIVVVTGAEHDAYLEVLAGLPVRPVRNPEWESGMGGSVAAGVRALAAETDAAFIVPGDLARVTGDVFRRLAQALADERGARVIVPVTGGGAQRNPVLWPSTYFPELAALRGPEGAKSLLASLGARRRDVAFMDETVFLDIDTGRDLARLVPGASV